MPKVTMFISSKMENFEVFAKKYPLDQVGSQIRTMIAEVFSTDVIKLESEHVDFLPILYPPGALVSSPISIEIETLGYPERKAKLTEEVIRSLKHELIVVLTQFPGCSPVINSDDPLLWLKYQDPDGFHL